MKRSRAILVVMLALVAALALAACGGKSEKSLVGTWEHTDPDTGISATYVLEANGTGTYTMKVEEAVVTYEMKYEVKDNHILVTFVNNKMFTEDDVFDSEFNLKDPNTLVIKDSFGGEMTFTKK